MIAPALLMPVPFNVRALVLAIAVPFRSSIAPLVKETAEAEAPNAATWPTFKVPALMVVPPVKVLLPVNVTVPVLPALPMVNAPLPLTTPAMASVAPVPAEIVPPPAPTTMAGVVAGPLDEPLVAELVSVPLFRVTVALP